MKAITAFILIVLLELTASLSSFDSPPDRSFNYDDNFALQLLVEFEQRYQYQRHSHHKGTRRINASDDFVPTTPAIFIGLCKGYHLSNEVINDDKITSDEAAAFFKYLCDELDYDSLSCINKTGAFTSYDVKIQVAFINFVCPKNDPDSEKCLEIVRQQNANSIPIQYTIESDKDLDQDVEDYCVALYKISSDYHRGTHEPTLAPSLAPSMSPTLAPSGLPSMTPSVTPSKSPTLAPSVAPSMDPSVVPSMSPSISLTPSNIPSLLISQPPSIPPSTSPSTSHTRSPSTFPTVSPTVSPTKSPSIYPSRTPSTSPTISPTISPTKSPAPTISFDYKRSFTYMMGFDDANVQFGVLVNDATGIKDSMSEAIVRVLTARSPNIARSLGSSKYDSDSSGKILEEEEKNGNKQNRFLELFTFSTESPGSGVEHKFSQGAKCTSEFILSTYCIIMVSEVTLKSFSETSKQTVDDAVYPSIKSSMSDTSFRDRVDRIEVKEVKYMNDGDYVPITFDPASGRAGIGLGAAFGIAIGCTLPVLLCLLLVCVWRTRDKPDDSESIESVNDFLKESAVSEESVISMRDVLEDEFEDNYELDFQNDVDVFKEKVFMEKSSSLIS